MPGWSGRRRWSRERKARIVEEALGAKVTEVARGNGAAASVAFTSRRQARTGLKRSSHVLRWCRLPRRRKRAGKTRSCRRRMTGGCGGAGSRDRTDRDRSWQPAKYPGGCVS
ncbi:transposase [Bradyrhizobium xenonodulans]|uniref:transposase n=1 Tax=Bradyrhizobium xenonodulans TaxID=2736875 RepID=UPI00351F3FE5